jgi:chloride channel protein, CIC family
MSDIVLPPQASRWPSVATYALGGLLGGLAGGAFVVVVTLALKAMMDFVSSQTTWVLIVVPLIGLILTVLVLQVCGKTETARKRARRAYILRTFPRGAIQADITGDVVDSAGEEERFPWRLTPIRTLAIFCTVGLGGAGSFVPLHWVAALPAWLR